MKTQTYLNKFHTAKVQDLFRPQLQDTKPIHIAKQSIFQKIPKANFDLDFQNTLQIPILINFKVFQITLKCIKEKRGIQKKLIELSGMLLH